MEEVEVGKLNTEELARQQVSRMPIRGFEKVWKKWDWLDRFLM